MAASSALHLAGSAVAAAAPTNRLSSSAAFGSSTVQRVAIRPAAKASCKVGEARASVNDEERSVAAKPQMLVAMVAAGAALAMNAAAPAPPALAGLFGNDTPKVERNSSSLLGNEGTGTKVGSNAASRESSSTGTPLGEGSSSGSGVNLNGLSAPDVGSAAQSAKSSVQGADPLKGIGNLNPFKSGSAPDVSGAAQDAKDSVQGAIPKADPLKNIGDLNPFKGAGTPSVPDVGATADKAKSSIQGADPLKNVGDLNPLKGASAPDVGATAQKAKASVQGAAPSGNPLNNIADLNPFKGGGVPDVAGEAKKSVGGLAGGFPSLDKGSSGVLSKEGTGNQVGSNSDVRGMAGTPLGEGAGNIVGENSSTRSSSSSGTPLGEGNLSGSGVKVGELFQGAPDVGGAAEKAKSSLQGAVPSVGTPDVSGAAAGAKSALGDLKSKLPGGK